MVDRHQLDRVDAQRLQVLDDRGMGDRGVGAARLLGDVGMGFGQALDVGLVDDGVGVLVVRWPVGAPVEVRVDHHRLRHARRGVVVVAAVRVAEVVAEQRLIPVEGSVDGLGVRVQQQLVGVAALAAGRIVGAVHAVAVPLARLDVGHEPVPDESIDLGQRDPGLGSVRVEQAQLDPLGHLAEQGEVGARAVIGGAQRIGLAPPHFRLTRFGPTGLQLAGGMTAGAGFIFELTGVAKEIRPDM